MSTQQPWSSGPGQQPPYYPPAGQPPPNYPGYGQPGAYPPAPPQQPMQYQPPAPAPTPPAPAPAAPPPAEQVESVPETPPTNPEAAPTPASEVDVPAASITLLEPTEEFHEMDVYLKALVEIDGSDLHIKADSPPRARVHGTLKNLPFPTLSEEDTDRLVRMVIRDDQIGPFEQTNEADFAYQKEGVGRFRVNAFRQRGAAGMVFRHVSVGAPDLSSLAVPEVLYNLSLEPRGLVLVTGPTGSGKTTTLAGMIDHINKNKAVNIVTIEDPIEVIHHDKMAMVNQREVGVDTDDFLAALRGAMRQDPDVILIGEMRDAETVKAALAAAETGHFVMSTLHTVDAQETVNRVIDFFPPHEQQQIRFALAGALRGVLCQRLVKRSNGQGRAVAMEIAINTGRIADAITDPEKTSTIMELVKDGAYYGMQTFDQHLIALYRDGVITLETAINTSTSPHDMQVEMRRLGIAGS